MANGNSKPWRVLALRANVHSPIKDRVPTLDAPRPDFAIPDVSVDGRAVLDVGCGTGYALRYSHYSRASRLVGIDVDRDAIAEGRAKFPELLLLYGSAEAIPFDACTFDVVVSRVALPYTDIRLSLSEIHRVLKPGGDLFLTMHDWYHQWEFLRGALKEGAPKRVLDHAYILPASLVFITTGKLISRPNGTRETFQTERSMRRELKRARFQDATFSRSPRHWRHQRRARSVKAWACRRVLGRRGVAYFCEGSAPIIMLPPSPPGAPGPPPPPPPAPPCCPPPPPPPPPNNCESWRMPPI